MSARIQITERDDATETQARALLQFDSVTEWGRWVQQQIIANAPRNGEASTQGGKARSWDLGVDLFGAIDMALAGGWAEGARKVKRGMHVDEPEEVRGPIKRRQRRVAGQRPHVAAFCAGAPRSMTTLRYTADAPKRDGRVVRVVMTIGRAHNVTATTATNMGVALAEYIDGAERAGYRVEVELRHVLREGGYTEKRIMVKSAHDPLSLAPLAFVLGHPAASRRLRFATDELALAAAKGGRPFGYGNSSDQLPWINEERAAGAMVIGYLGRNMTRDEARAYVKHEATRAERMRAAADAA